MKNRPTALVLSYLILLIMIVSPQVLGQRAKARIKPKVYRTPIGSHTETKPGTGGVFRTPPTKETKRKWPEADGGGTTTPPIKKITPTPTPTPRPGRMVSKPKQ